jgi:two-component system, NarL family, sensor kinase
LVLCITDDGCGFDVKNVELSRDRGIGLSNMRERVERNGGSFELVSSPGGTALKASFPFAEAA